MSANVGLSTPRGSGTSGYIQRSLSALHPRDNHQSRDSSDGPIAPVRRADPAILAHERRRKIEASVFALRDSLEESDVPEAEIEERCAALRTKLLAEDARAGPSAAGPGRGEKLKTYQSHDIAAAKIVEDERLRRALGIRGEGERERSPRRGGPQQGRREWDRARPRREGRRSRSRSPPRRDGGRRDWDRPRVRRRSRSRSPRRSESRSLSRSRSPRRERDRDDGRRREWDRPKTRRGARSRSRSESRRRSPSRDGSDRD